QTAADTNIWCLVCGDLGAVDVGLNILLFIPLGIGLSLMGVSRPRALVIVGLTTLTVEVLQLSIITGRDASLSDLLTNSAGGMLGIWLAPGLSRLVFPSPVVALRLAAGGIILWLLQQTFAAWALERRPTDSVYYGQWAPELAQFDRFTGTVSRVTLNGLPLGSGRFAESDVVRGELARPSFEVNVGARSGTLTERTAPIFSIFDDHQREILLLGASRRDLVFHLRTRLDGLRLRSPSIVLPGAIPENPDQPLAIRVKYDGAVYHLDARDPRAEVAGNVRVSASWGWSFVLPFAHNFGPGTPWLTMLWLAGFWVPIGYWAGRSGGRASVWWTIIALTFLIGLAGVPAGFGLQIGATSEWAAALIGALAGWAFHRLHNRR
ncbi:MAG: VanZ family protein, partial [Gemmatimonadota bacterium]